MLEEAIDFSDLEIKPPSTETRRVIERMLELGYGPEDLVVASDGTVRIDEELARFESFERLYDPDATRQDNLATAI